MTHLPNAISLARLLSMPVVVLLMLYQKMTSAFWVFVLASISDAIDGYLARKFNIGSTLGVYLDPLADKILLVAVFLVLGHMGSASILLVSFVVTRDVLILTSVLYLRKRLGDKLGSPVFISKIHTLLQMAFATLVLGKEAFSISIDQELLDVLSYGIIGTTIFSVAEYIKIGLRLLKKQ